MSTDDTEIQIPDDAPAETPVVEAKDAPIEAKKPDILEPEAGLEKLKKQLEDAKQARAEAEQRERDARASETRARSENQDSQLHLVTTAIANVTQAMEMGETAYANALAAQDFALAAKLNREMNVNAAKLQKLEDGKQALERTPKPEIRETPRTADPVEAFASQLSGKSASWIREHPECVTDSRMNRKMLAAHQMALADGIAADSPEYFDFIEDTLKLRADPEPVAESRPVRRAAPASAPVSRSGNGAGERQNVVRISKEEAEMAAMMGMTTEEYAKNKYALKKEGRMN